MLPCACTWTYKAVKELCTYNILHWLESKEVHWCAYVHQDISSSAYQLSAPYINVEGHTWCFIKLLRKAFWVVQGTVLLEKGFLEALWDLWKWAFGHQPLSLFEFPLSMVWGFLNHSSTRICIRFCFHVGEIHLRSANLRSVTFKLKKILKELLCSISVFFFSWIMGCLCMPGS